jgi:hypothetical protein
MILYAIACYNYLALGISFTWRLQIVLLHAAGVENEVAINSRAHEDKRAHLFDLFKYAIPR